VESVCNSMWPRKRLFLWAISLQLRACFLIAGKACHGQAGVSTCERGAGLGGAGWCWGLGAMVRARERVCARVHVCGGAAAVLTA
jgi:hypothetical protein